MSDEFSDLSDFTFSLPDGLFELAKCGCGGLVYGRMQGDQKRYLQTESGRDIKLCNECDEKEYPPESMKLLAQVSKNAIEEDNMRQQYNIPYDRGVKEWLIEMDGKRVTVNNETITVVNIYNKSVF